MTKYEDTDGRWRQDIERRLRALETGPRAPFTSIPDEDGNELVRLDRDGVHIFDATTGDELVTIGNNNSGGGLWLRDRAGNTRAFFGDFDDPDSGNRYGMSLYDSKGDVVLAVDADREGLVYPQAFAQWQVPTMQTITSGTFVEVAEVYIQNLNHDVIYTDGAIIVDAATSAEVRIRESNSGATTNTLTVAGSANGSVVCEWLHPFSVGWGDSNPDLSVWLKYEVRRTAGVGNVYVFPPRGIVLGNRAFFDNESASTALRFV